MENNTNDKNNDQEQPHSKEEPQVLQSEHTTMNSKNNSERVVESEECRTDSPCSLFEGMPPEMSEYLNKEKARLKVQDEFVEDAKKQLEPFQSAPSC